MSQVILGLNYHSTKKDDRREQRKPCLICEHLIDVNEVYACYSEMNGFGGQTTHYYHWDCFVLAMKEFIEETEREFGDDMYATRRQP